MMKTKAILMVILSILLISCSNHENVNGYQTDGKAAATLDNKVPIADNPDAQGGKMTTVTMETTKGNVKIELFTDKVPITTKNFIDLTNAGFYNGLKFHRVEPGFVVQGGDPSGDGTGGSEKKIPLEVTPELKHLKGYLGMARTNDPNSATSQFYFSLADLPMLDGQYAVFAKVVEGMEVVEKLEIGDKMNKVYVNE